MTTLGERMTIGDINVDVMENVQPAKEISQYIAKQFDEQTDDSAFFVFNTAEVVARHQLWLEHMPRARPFYAVKCNSDPLLVRLLAALGCGFDCASKGEIELVDGLVDPVDDIIYANPCKTRNYIRHACEKGVQMMTFDNEDELKKVALLAPSARMILRINVSDPTARCQLSIKFGCDPEVGAYELLDAAKALNVDVVGISFHVGSGCRDPSAYARAITYTRKLFDYGNKIGHRMNIVDIGGGFPGYDDGGMSFEDMAAVINGALNIHFPEGDDVTIIAEPGRFYAAKAFTLCCTVMAKTKCPAARIVKDSENKETGYMYYINDGVYGSFNCLIYDHGVADPKTLFENNNTESWAAVWGPTCDGLDIVAPKTRLPILTEGDWVFFADMGAYTLAAGSSFNGFPRPKVFYFMSRKHMETYMPSMQAVAKQAPAESSGIDSETSSDTEW